MNVKRETLKSTISTASLILLFVIINLALVVLAIFQINPDLFRREISEEERAQRIAVFQQAFFAQRFLFDNNSGYHTSHIQFVISHNPIFNNIVFVETWQEGIESDFPTDVIVAWPTPLTEGVLQYLNERALRRDIDWEYYGLSYPITMDDVLLRWDKVNQIWLHEQASSRSSLELAAEYFGDAHKAYLDEIAEARREKGIPEPVDWCREHRQ